MLSKFVLVSDLTIAFFPWMQWIWATRRQAIACYPNQDGTEGSCQDCTGHISLKWTIIYFAPAIKSIGFLKRMFIFSRCDCSTTICNLTILHFAPLQALHCLLGKMSSSHCHLEAPSTKWKRNNRKEVHLVTWDCKDYIVKIWMQKFPPFQHVANSQNGRGNPVIFVPICISVNEYSSWLSLTFWLPLVMSPTHDQNFVINFCELILSWS